MKMRGRWKESDRSLWLKESIPLKHHKIETIFILTFISCRCQVHWRCGFIKLVSSHHPSHICKVIELWTYVMYGIWLQNTFLLVSLVAAIVKKQLCKVFWVVRAEPPQYAASPLCSDSLKYLMLYLIWYFSVGKCVRSNHKTISIPNEPR